MKRFFYALTVTSILAISVLTQEKRISSTLLGLANAERAFAKMSVEKGVREAFYNNFAEDGINFTPHPNNFRESYRKSPAPKTPPPITLNWAPIYGDISQAGDLGYTTGPYTIVDHSPAKRPTQHGMYFSIWKKQADQSWKVVLDLGIKLPSAFAPLDALFQAAPHVNAPPLRTNVMDDERPSIPQLDFRFYEAAKNRGLMRGWTDALSPDAYIYRQGEMPVIGKESLKKWAGNQLGSFKLNWTKTGLSESDDLGYSYGSYEIEKKSGGEKGYYARVWKRDMKGDWRIVFDVTVPLPEEKKQEGQ